MYIPRAVPYSLPQELRKKIIATSMNNTEHLQADMTGQFYSY